ncbi:branched-chain amino acid ABC transporter permease [Roseobacter weihaiensis]|uniref:branched-chain amino acid ABC transporter permease n=1 Tax=Roseobacter weihaiensis TaxID=2763262 RepID=UPI001D09D84F|nr:branched-chain amino acid ABC transporter permease [Roseobacter sp. H9]
MDIFLQILISGLSLGAMYAVGTIALSLLWGTMGMMNLAHGGFIAIGGYLAYWCMTVLGASWIFVLPLALAGGMLSGYLMYHLVVRWMFERKEFGVDIIIATVAIAALVENGLLNIAGPSAKRQPFALSGGLRIGDVVLPYQTILTVVIAIILLIVVFYIVTHTKLGIVIRAISQQQTASRLMGVNTRSAFAKAMMLAGGIAAVSGVLVTGATQLFPSVGFDTTIKALVICIIAGLGNLRGAIFMAFVLGLFEVAVQYIFGQRYGFPAMLGLVIVVLIIRPNGLFGKATVDRV